MDSRLRWLHRESERWVADGDIDATGRDRILRRYEDQAAEPSLAVYSFYLLGGVLLGAAVFALFAFLELRDWISTDGPAAWYLFLGFGTLWLGLAFMARRSGNTEFADALQLAGLINTAALVGPEPPADLLRLLAPAAAAWVLWDRRSDLVIPTVALAAMIGTLIAALAELTNNDDQWTLAFFLSTTLILAGSQVWTRMRDLPWQVSGSVVASAAAAAGWLAIVMELLSEPFTFDGRYEILFALGMAVLLGVGIWLRDKPMIYVAGIAITIDAVVFAFDLGGVEWGLGTLIVLSGGMLFAATALRRRRENAA